MIDKDRSMALASDLDPIRLMREMLRWTQRFEDFPTFSQDTFFPAIEVKETEGGYEVHADVPGLKPEDVDISVTGNRLTLSGRRESESRNEGERYHTYERSYGTFTRSFTLPEGANVDNVSAELADGVLRLSIPKRPEIQPRKVQVQSANTLPGQPGVKNLGGGQQEQKRLEQQSTKQTSSSSKEAQSRH